MTLGSRPAFWIGGQGDGSAVVLTSTGASAYWYAWGWLARSDLLRLAASLPVESLCVGVSPPR
ncbi:MAG: ferritin-like domain-containing protein [Chloroflexota bacterium]|nr:ferritin-like domain-containing protein [Chloroflexota bacterium]